MDGLRGDLKTKNTAAGTASVSRQLAALKSTRPFRPSRSEAVHIVDDNSRTRVLIRDLAETIQLTTHQYLSAQDFLDNYDAGAGCIVLDVRMPGKSGLDLQLELFERGIGLPVIMVTGHADVPMAVQAMERGAVGFLQKPFHNEELIELILRALQLDRRNRDRSAHLAKMEKKYRQLTPRELEVFELVVQGRPNKAIATDLRISPRTVEVHRARVMEKLGVTSAAALVSFAVRYRALRDSVNLPD